MTAIGIIGNCQVEPIAEMLRSTGDCDVTVFVLARLKAEGRLAVDRAALAGFDHILSQDAPILATDPVFAPLRPEAIRATNPRVTRFPNILFTGLQPDCAMVRLAGRKLKTPLGDYSSKIVAAGFLVGMDPVHLHDLFNAYTYAALGYFDEFEKARAYLSAAFEAAGFDFSDFESAAFAGRFMHTVNHPAVSTLRALTGMIAARIGLGGAVGLPEADGLAANTVWPIYPEIARRLRRHADDLLFKPPGADDRMPLLDFIEGSYRAYDAHRDVVAAQPWVGEVANTLRAITGKTYASAARPGP